MYKIKENDLKYINEVFEEIIRGVIILINNFEKLIINY